MPSSRVRLGIVGCGAVSMTDYFPALDRPPLRDRVELVAVCDVAIDRARSAAELYGAREVWSDFDAMVAETSAEALVLLTPIPCHFAQGSAAIRAGKHVYIQKTMTTTYNEARELISMAEKQGVILTAAPGQMLDPAHRMAKDLIDKDVVGKVCFARGMGSHPGHENVNTYGADPTWYYRPGGGPVMDVAVYPLHSLTGLLGPVERVTAFSGVVLANRIWRGKPIEVQMDDNTLLLLDFGHAVYAEINGTFCRRASHGTPQIELYCERGVIYIGGWLQREVPLKFYIEADVLGFKRGWYEPEGLVPEMKHTVADLVHFADCIRDNLKPVNTAAHAAHVIEIIEKGYLAARSGRAQMLESKF